MEHTPANLASDMAEKLKAWTGKTWLISVVNKQGGKTLLQEAQETKANLRKTMSANPVVSAVIMAFPGAKIDSIRERAEETDDTSNSEDYE